MVAPVAFVGREAELTRLLAALARGVPLVLVVGDAGVGKTRFVAEGMARAAAAGTVTVRGDCLPLAEALPLLPVTAALAELAAVDGGRLIDAALKAAPPYVPAEIGRLRPALDPSGDSGPWAGRDEGWRRQRLFAAVAALLDAVADQTGHGVRLVAEDVHWADSATLDMLTFLVRGGCRSPVTVVATCRGDESPVAGHVAAWVATARGTAAVEEIRLGPLGPLDMADLAAAIAGSPVPARMADDLYARAEGNPFFTEQLVAAALAAGTGARLAVPAGLPERLAELLASRAGRCAGDARAVLVALAVAGRPLAEDLLVAVTGLDSEAVRGGLRELAEARLLAEDTAGGTCRLRHALLAEAVAGGLLPAEQAALHGSSARALASTRNPAVAAEIAGHWRAAMNAAEELPARIMAAEAAERVCGYADAAAHWQRAIELSDTQPAVGRAIEDRVQSLYLRAIDALEWSGDSRHAALVAEEAYRRFAGHPDPGTAAAVSHRAAYYRAITGPPVEFPLIEKALQLFEQVPPSPDHAQAWLDYAHTFLRSGGRERGEIVPALNQALAIAEASGAAGLIPRILGSLAMDAFRRGQVEEGFAFLDRGWALARAANDPRAQLWLAINESDALLKLARFQDAADVALSGLGPARQAGLGSSWGITFLAANASEALLACGRTAEAAALIDPLTTGPPDRDQRLVHEARAEIDLLRGDTGAAAERRRLIDAIPARRGTLDAARESVRQAAELALWVGDPGGALAQVRRMLPLLKSPDLAIGCGRLLTTGMRACAELAQQGRARRDGHAADAATSAADSLVAWVGQVAGAPFTDHRFVATIPAERATWDAERTRLAGASDPQAWRAAAEAWQDLSCPHRAGYAWWRQAEAQLDAGQPSTTASGPLRLAAAAAAEHALLLARVSQLADRARILLRPSAHAVAETPLPAESPAPYKLTSRELAVLRLLAAGRTNAQIGAELYISPKTAGVHVSSILRKLEVSGRVQAAALAERAGLLS